MRRSWSAWLCAAVVAIGAPALAYDLIGPDKCKSCHPTAYAAWKQSKHFSSKSSLTDAFAKDARCLTCHEPEESRGYSGVQCETCHGGGQFYKEGYVMKDAELARAVGLLDPTAASCVKCHDAAAPSVKPFAFDEKVKLIDHWTVERDARRAASQAESAPAKPPATTQPTSKP